MLTRERLPAALLALILLVALGLRVWSLGHGLPYAYNLDERAHFVPHAVAMTSGDLNPGYFINPPALTYLLAAWLSVIHLGGVEQWFADDAGAVFLAGRWIAVIFGVGAVAATYAAGRAWFGRTAGLVAAAILAVAFLPVFYSRLALNDGPAMLPCALALWASAIVLRTGSRRALLAGGACVGAAAALKYSDGAIVVALVAAALLSPALTFRQAFTGLALAGLVALAVVIATNPYLFADWGTFTHDLDRQRKFAGGAALLGQPERNGWWYYLTSGTVGARDRARAAGGRRRNRAARQRPPPRGDRARLADRPLLALHGQPEPLLRALDAAALPRARDPRRLRLLAAVAPARAVRARRPASP